MRFSPNPNPNLHAREQLDASPYQLARARRDRQLGLPQGHLLERLQPDGEVEELRVGVRPQRVRVVLRVLLEPHLHLVRVRVRGRARAGVRARVKVRARARVRVRVC